MTSQTLLLERLGPIVRLKLNRPDKRNAQSLEMWRELKAVGVALEDDPEVRVVVVSGEGHAFSAGIDLTVLMAQGQAAGTGDAPIPDVSEVQLAFTWLRDARFATIAMVHGYALGAGMQLALACDIRMAADDATFALPEVNFGILPDLGGCAWLPELVGPAKAKELIFLGDRFDAQTAHRLGIVNQLTPPGSLEAVTMAMAERIAKQAPLAIGATKRAIRAAESSADAGLRTAAAEVRKLLVSNDFKEATGAAAARRAPRYTGT